MLKGCLRGQSFPPPMKMWRPRNILGWLLTGTCVIFYFSLEGEAIKCQSCVRQHWGKACLPIQNTCEIASATAVCGIKKHTKYKADGKVLSVAKWKDCYVDKTNCENKLKLSYDPKTMEIKCCSDKDFCNGSI